MSNNYYDNWERLVRTVLLNEKLREIALCPSISSCSLTSASLVSGLAPLLQLMTPFFSVGIFSHQNPTPVKCTILRIEIQRRNQDLLGKLLPWFCTVPNDESNEDAEKRASIVCLQTMEDRNIPIVVSCNEGWKEVELGNLCWKRRRWRGGSTIGRENCDVGEEWSHRWRNSVSTYEWCDSTCFQAM